MYLFLKRKLETVPPSLKRHYTNCDLIKETLSDNIRLRLAESKKINPDEAKRLLNEIIDQLTELKRKF